MTTAEDVRIICGLSTDVVSNAVLEQAVVLAEEWCQARARAYSTTAPKAAVVSMALYYLRAHLDLAGIKPSSISMPDLSMSTDFRSASELLKADAIEAIKAQAFSRGSAVRHIRSGRVSKW